MAQDASIAIRSGVIALPKRGTFTVIMTRATATAGSKLIDQIHVVARLTQQRAKPFTLDGFLELAVLVLFPVTDRDHSFLTASEFGLELP